MFFVIEGNAKKRPPATNGSGANGRDGVRWDRIRNARARAAAGYYDRPDVRDRVVEALLRELDRD